MKVFSHPVGINSRKLIKFWTYILQLVMLCVNGFTRNVVSCKNVRHYLITRVSNSLRVLFFRE